MVHWRTNGRRPKLSNSGRKVHLRKAGLRVRNGGHWMTLRDSRSCAWRNRCDMKRRRRWQRSRLLHRYEGTTHEVWEVERNVRGFTRVEWLRLRIQSILHSQSIAEGYGVGSNVCLVGRSSQRINSIYHNNLLAKPNISVSPSELLITLYIFSHRTSSYWIL